MLSDYKDKQPLAYNLFVNDIFNNCVTHAYLIDENNYSDSFKMVLSFVKSILCQNKYIDNSKCENCSLCRRIDDGNYPEIKIISADGMYIKKQQIIELQQEFSRSAIEGKKRIYIIRDCEKMRLEAANSMLKFLEEPEDDIIAILMTNNINNVLSTIISRCKVVKLVNASNEMYNDDSEELKNLAFNFLFDLENKGIDFFVNARDMWFSVIGQKDRDKMIKVFDIMIDLYYDMMKIITGNNNINYLDISDKLEELVKLNKLDNILKKINILLEAKDSIKFNVNSNLLIDTVVVEIGGVIDGSRC